MTGTPQPPEWFTAAIGAPVTLGEVQVEGVRIRFRSWGRERGRPGLLLVHGGAAHARWWDHVAPLLATDRRVAALDLSGHGDSDRRPAYSLDQWAVEVLAVAAVIGRGAPPVLVGHSMGGNVAIRAASRPDAALSGLIVLDSPQRVATPEEAAARSARAFGPLRRYATKADALAHFRPVPDQSGNLDYVLAHVAETSMRALDGGWTWKFDPAVFARAGHPTDPGMPPRCPTTFLRAEHGMVTDDMVRLLPERLGSSLTVREVPGAGHHVMLDRPLALVDMVRVAVQEFGPNSGSSHQG